MLGIIFSPLFSLLAASGHGGPVKDLGTIPIVQKVALIVFILAVAHTFLVKRFESLALRCSDRPLLYGLFHFLGEIEAVFGIWALFLMTALIPVAGEEAVVHYLSDGSKFIEPVMVFVIMTIAATAPVMYAAEKMILKISHLLPMPNMMAFYFTALTMGPLLGSFITEPAAMTVTALILKTGFFDQSHITRNFKYATLGALFVNISIGGTLTHFAAPPVLMVAGPWEWDIQFMMTHFGWKAAIAVFINVIVTMFVFRDQLQGSINEDHVARPNARDPKAWIVLVHIAFLALAVWYAHYIPILLGLLIFFVGWCKISYQYQERLHIKEALLVGFFLAGLVVIGKLQAWWIKPLIGRVPESFMYLGATGLTAFTDNAALTYLGTLVDGLSDSVKYFLVAGAVTGGGLTVIANAPNPAGFGILKSSFRKKTISPMGLAIGAGVPTFIAFLCLRFLPSNYDAPKAKSPEKAPIAIEEIHQKEVIKS